MSQVSSSLPLFPTTKSHMQTISFCLISFVYFVYSSVGLDWNIIDKDQSSIILMTLLWFQDPSLASKPVWYIFKVNLSYFTWHFVEGVYNSSRDIWRHQWYHKSKMRRHCSEQRLLQWCRHPRGAEHVHTSVPVQAQAGLSKSYISNRLSFSDFYKYAHNFSIWTLKYVLAILWCKVM